MKRPWMPEWIWVRRTISLIWAEIP
jgi:hypothetical protein